MNSVLKPLPDIREEAWRWVIKWTATDREPKSWNIRAQIGGRSTGYELLEEVQFIL